MVLFLRNNYVVVFTQQLWCYFYTTIMVLFLRNNYGVVFMQQLWCYFYATIMVLFWRNNYGDFDATIMVFFTQQLWCYFYATIMVLFLWNNYGVIFTQQLWCYALLWIRRDLFRIQLSIFRVPDPDPGKSWIRIRIQQIIIR